MKNSELNATVIYFHQWYIIWLSEDSMSVNAPIKELSLTWRWTEDIGTTEYLNVFWSSVHRWPECDAL